MNNPEPTLRVQVDVTNPGQFFACCGLLELAHRLDHRSMGWFEAGNFNLIGMSADLIQKFLSCAAKPVAKIGDDSENKLDKDSNKGDEKTVPIWLGEPFNLRLDWWNSDSAQDAKLKTWSAGQKVTDLFIGKTASRTTKKGEKSSCTPSMRDRLRDSFVKNPDDWLRMAEPIESPKAFCYDSRLSRTTALDMGHNDKRYVMAFSPAVDVLTIVGLQRFRPLTIETWTRNRYYTWCQPVSAEIAAVVVLGIIPELGDSCFEFPIKRLDAAGKFKLFGNAQPIRRMQ